jgi:hypothetical protein
MAHELKHKLTAWLQRDWLALLLFVIAVVVMTYPLAFRPAEGLPNRRQDNDILTSFWQMWWVGEVLKHGHNPNFTTYLYHPNGLDITFQPRPWAALGVWMPLRSLLGDVASFNVSLMLGLLASAYCAYLLIHHLTGNRVAAWSGGAFFAFYPAHLFRAMRQPTTGSIQWLPLFMLALVAGLQKITADSPHRQDDTRRVLVPMLLAAGALSLNAYISIKPWLQAVVLAGLYVPLAALANGWWRKTAFWKGLGTLALFGLLFVLPVIYPYLLGASEVGLQDAIQQKSIDLFRKGADAFAYVKGAPELPVLMPRSLARLKGLSFTEWHRGDSLYLGLTSMLLAVLGLTNPNQRRAQRLVWLTVALALWGLSLGMLLRANSVEYEGVWTPYQLVAGIPLFQAARIPHRFALGFSLAWAVLVGFGVAFVWNRLQMRRWLAPTAVGVLVALMLFEIAEVPISLDPLPKSATSAFYNQLRSDDDAGALIDLPMGRPDVKKYMYLQTIHRKPIVDGTVARRTEDISPYITHNPLLLAWQEQAELTCDYDLESALEILYADGFRYVVVHKRKPPEWTKGYFAAVEPVFRDDHIHVYALADLVAAPPCADQ